MVNFQTEAMEDFRTPVKGDEKGISEILAQIQRSLENPVLDQSAVGQKNREWEKNIRENKIGGDLTPPKKQLIDLSKIKSNT